MTNGGRELGRRRERYPSCDYRDKRRYNDSEDNEEKKEYFDRRPSSSGRTNGANRRGYCSQRTRSSTRRMRSRSRSRSSSSTKRRTRRRRRIMTTSSSSTERYHNNDKDRAPYRRSSRSKRRSNSSRRYDGYDSPAGPSYRRRRRSGSSDSSRRGRHTSRRDPIGRQEYGRRYDGYHSRESSSERRYRRVHSSLGHCRDRHRRRSNSPKKSRDDPDCRGKESDLHSNSFRSSGSSSHFANRQSCHNMIQENCSVKVRDSSKHLVNDKTDRYRIPDRKRNGEYGRLNESQEYKPFTVKQRTSSNEMGNVAAKQNATIEANTNIIKATITNNFFFYQYGLDSTSANGSRIISTRRRAHIFFSGIFDKNIGILAKTGMKEKEIEDFRRVTYFEGSFVFTARPIPTVDTFPFIITTDDVDTDIKLSPCDLGDVLTITSMKKYYAPKELTIDRLKSSENGIVVDLRCSGCTSVFATKEAMISHCKQTGHAPHMDLDEEIFHASSELFLSYCNITLQHALIERMARWGREYIDPKHWTEPKDKFGRSLGVRVFRAFFCEFGIHKLDGQNNSLTLTVDLRAKVIRTKSLLMSLCNGKDPNHVAFDRRDISHYRKQYQGEVVICTYDRKCYPVVDIDFNNSPDSLMVEGCEMSHTEYFKKRKGLDLMYPNVAPMVAVLGRSNKIIFFPAELVCANDFDRSIKQQLPSIASFKPKERNEAIEEIRKYLIPGGQRTKGFGGGLLPSLGIILEEKRIKVPAEVLPLPLLSAAGITIPQEKSQSWAPVISKANWSVDHDRAVKMNVVVIHHQSLNNHVIPVYNKIRDIVNNHNSFYRFPPKPFSLISTNGDEDHCRGVQDYFHQRLPKNVFVLDLVRPPRRQALDTAYYVVKYLLTKNGYLSQFVNFNTHDHSRLDDQKAIRRSNSILHGVARQILSKCGARIWWVNIPKEIPVPAIFVGVDVFHSPLSYCATQGRKVAKASVAAIVVQVIRSHDERDNTHTEIFSQTFKRERGKEMGLGKSIQETVSNALRILNVNPMSCFIWRDGVGNAAVKSVASEEITAVRSALGNTNNSSSLAPLSYVVVQKRISTKFLTCNSDVNLPPGSFIDTIQGPEFHTFYINGSSPSYSTSKPARYIVAHMDPELAMTNKSLAELSWSLCHDYSNWTGSIKLPSPVQYAHKLAELHGSMPNSAEDIGCEILAGKPHFL
eukprot:CAMPEP_0176489722 /NCGR_PEP_ID=MMETSP0200_2-20121128/7458_1 /TAXON_ID=947934 /ORGANISM="Chaetoceros sp., Strain GSL56" /LENGTH=1195 /DNA_ID=CAMNT_0017886919 /DNA_START=173 /DNA_END=3760 /DNA_ORIENTATION=-